MPINTTDNSALNNLFDENPTIGFYPGYYATLRGYPPGFERSLNVEVQLHRLPGSGSFMFGDRKQKEMGKISGFINPS